MLRCGVDLVFIPEFQKRAKRSGGGLFSGTYLTEILQALDDKRKRC